MNDPITLALLAAFQTDANRHNYGGPRLLIGYDPGAEPGSAMLRDDQIEAQRFAALINQMIKERCRR